MSKNLNNKYFQKDWLENPKFKTWSVKASNNKYAKCRHYDKIFEISNMGEVALNSHIRGEKHKHKMFYVFLKVSLPLGTLNMKKQQQQKILWKENCGI